MYLPEHFTETDPANISALINAAPLACIIAHTETGLLANHIPLLAGTSGTLIGHVAEANDMHRLLRDGQDVLAIFQGSQGYVSPNFYPSKQEHHRHVPTWNYMVVHAHGQIQFHHDTHAKHAAVGLLTRWHERRLNGSQAWRMGDAPPDYMAEMLDKIVAFKIVVSRMTAKTKLSQNREARDYDGAMDGLRAAGDTDVADAMASHAAARGRPLAQP